MLSLRKTPCTASCFSYSKPSSKQGVCLPVTKSFDTYMYIYIYELLSYWVLMTGLSSSTLNTQQPSILSHHCNDPLEIPQGLVLQMWGGKASATRCMWPYQCGGRHFKNDEKNLLGSTVTTLSFYETALCDVSKRHVVPLPSEKYWTLHWTWLFQPETKDINQYLPHGIHLHPQTVCFRSLASEFWPRKFDLTFWHRNCLQMYWLGMGRLDPLWDCGFGRAGKLFFEAQNTNYDLAP